MMKFKAEGMKNVVFSLGLEENTVLRVRKRKKNQGDKEVHDEAIKRRSFEREFQFYNKIMMPLLSPYCPPIHIMPLDTSIWYQIQEAFQKASPERATRFIKQTELDLQIPFAFHLKDHTTCSINNINTSKTLCIEIKPKCGQFISGDTTQYQCTYCLRQKLKIDHDDITRKSGYCPRDLFSGKMERIAQAISALFYEPQNNLKMFFDGKLQYTGNLGGKHAHLEVQQFEQLDPFLEANFFTSPVDSELSKTLLLIQIISSILYEQRKCLELIESGQKMQNTSAASILRLYRCMMDLDLGEELEEYCIVHKDTLKIEIEAREVEKREKLAAASSKELEAILGSVMNEEYNTMKRIGFQMIQDFLLAASLKDCSIMVSCLLSASSSPLPLPSPWKRFEFPPVSILYKISIIDVDAKPPSNIPKYAAMEERLLAYL